MLTRCRPLSLLALIFLAGLPLAAQQPGVSIPPGGRALLSSEAGRALPVLPKEPGFATAENVHAVDTPWADFWRFDITKAPANPWNVQLGSTVTGQITKGDKCVLVFYVRAVEGKASGAAHVEVRTPPDYPKLGSTEFKAGTKWESVVMPFVASEDGPEGKCGVAIHLGVGVQKLDLGGLRLIDYGPDFPKEKLPYPYVHYEGREADAPWRKEASDRIENLRKGDFNLVVTDKAGAPLAGAEIHAVLKRHAFGFGSAVTAKWLNDASPDGERYRAIVDECFSRVVFENDLKMFAWEAEKDPNAKGNFRKDWLDQSLAWLAERHFTVRGHYLCWAPYEPWSVKLKDNPQAIRAKVLAHMREMVPAVGDRVTEWDALNHPAGWEKGICIDTVLGSDFYSEVFKEARKLTRLPLWINEDQVFRPGRQQEEYYTVIQKLIADGAKPDGIGNQAHFHSSYLPSPREILANSDRFAKLVPALQLTEFDVNTNGDEQLAADFTRDVLITTFSHPAYTGMVMWGFWEGAHWKPDTAPWRKDWTEKPAAKVWRELVCGEWRTDVTVKTDANGRGKLRGFYGRYDVTIKSDGATCTLPAVLEKAAKDEVHLVLRAN
jgi:GH35 family endo-1,4-beta-xylanase